MRLSLHFELRHDNDNICKCVTFTPDLSQEAEKGWDVNGCLFLKLKFNLINLFFYGLMLNF